MSRRFSEFFLLFVLGIAVALVPIACGSDSGGTDAHDAVNSMTPG
jgi:hypothetical protein